MSLWGNYELCPKWFEYFQELLNIESTINLYNTTLPFIAPKTRSYKRIGPHNYNTLCVLIGSILGDAQAERHGNGTRICFQQEHSNSHYLLWFHKYLSDLGYCNSIQPKLATRLGVGGKLRYVLRFKTYTFSSFNFLHEEFYKEGVKIVPANIGDYLSPLALAVWLSDDGGSVGSGFKFSTNSFSLKDDELLCKVLRDKYNLKASIQKTGYSNQYVIYISKISMQNLADIVKPHLHGSMYYKLNGYI
jgi:ubiquinol-cytochrome c reductase cytochrome b subunit